MTGQQCGMELRSFNRILKYVIHNLKLISNKINFLSTHMEYLICTFN